MRYSDRLYGPVSFEDPVIEALVESPPLKRLKEVDQGGYFHVYRPGAAYSRFEHSVGVYALLRRFGASLEEQAAGLLHDVSHTVFSHCADYALAEGSESAHSYQDDIFQDYVRSTDIPDLLRRHGLDPEYVLKEHNFPLLERELPDLCADRIDYSLRTAVVYGLIGLNEAGWYLDCLDAGGGRWFFEDQRSARRFASLFRELNDTCFAGPESAAMFRTVGDVLKHSLENGYVSRNDLFTTDSEILKKIRMHLDDDHILAGLWDRMNNRYGFTIDSENYHTKVTCKSRLVDPLFKEHDQLHSLSETIPRWAIILKNESTPRVHHLKFGSSANSY